MPGYLKRVSISFYARCMMYDAAEHFGVQPDRRSIFLPVGGTTATDRAAGGDGGVAGALGMVVFSRTQYREVV